MNNPPYEYNKVHAYRYIFESTGKRTITKVVEFSSTEMIHVYNLAFGDLLPNDEIDDTVISNNGDIIKIFATVIDILQDFTWCNPSFIILFMGSTPLRTLLYKRILKTYYQSIRTQFSILGVIATELGPIEVPFDMNSTDSYFAFLVKRI